VVREILIWPESVLAKPCEPITTFDDELRRKLHDLKDTMLHAKGAGLAAPQVGWLIRAIVVLVVDKDSGARSTLALCNPIVERTRGSANMREGCLSLPGFFDTVKRHTWVKVVAQDEQGARVEVESDGVLAHCLQHEIDHLEGVVFTDHLSLIKRNLARTRFQKAKAKGLRYVVEAPAPQDFTKLGEES
jgi:peptide deformylase